jgi:predicted transcriptional regulator
VFEENDASLTIDTDVSGNITSSLLAIKARDIMLREIVWTDPDDSVRDVFEKMHTSGDHVIVGTEGIAAGIVSKDSLKGIASSYLQPLMSKWKQDRNDAVLDIEIKWLMNRQMQTISEDTSCTAIMKKMHQYSTALPVVDRNNKVLGLVTPFNVSKVRALLKLESVSAQQK